MNSIIGGNQWELQNEQMTIAVYASVAVHEGLSIEDAE